MGEIRKVEKTGDEGQRRERKRKREILYCTIMLYCYVIPRVISS